MLGPADHETEEVEMWTHIGVVEMMRAPETFRTQDELVMEVKMATPTTEETLQSRPASRSGDDGSVGRELKL